MVQREGYNLKSFFHEVGIKGTVGFASNEAYSLAAAVARNRDATLDILSIDGNNRTKLLH